jgi:anti-sigma factor RsiW
MEKLAMTGACRGRRRALWLLVDGTLAERDRLRLLAHLEACPRCRLHLQAARALDSALAAGSRETPRAGFEERVLLGIASGVTEGALQPPAAPLRRPRPDRAAEEAGDWWVLGGGLAAAALVGAAAVSIVPRLALRAAVAAAAPGSGSPGSSGILARGLRLVTSSGEGIAALVNSPLFWPLMLMAGVVALTLAGIRFAFSRPAPAVGPRSD